MNLLQQLEVLLADAKSDLRHPKFLNWITKGVNTPEEIVQADTVTLAGAATLTVALPQVTGPDGVAHTISASRCLVGHSQDSVTVDDVQRLDGRVGVRAVSTLIRLDLVIDITWTDDSGVPVTVEIRCRHNYFNL